MSLYQSINFAISFRTLESVLVRFGVTESLNYLSIPNFGKV